MCSHGIGISALEPLTVGSTVVANDHNHLVQLGANLDAAGEARKLRVGLTTLDKAFLFGIRDLVALLEVRLGDVDRALAT